jgi:hypothetical protein
LYKFWVNGEFEKMDGGKLYSIGGKKRGKYD